MIVPLDHAICSVEIKKSALCVELMDGRQLCAPLEWFPMLSAARDHGGCRIASDGLSVEWPDLGERVTVEFLLAGRHGTVMM